MIGTSSEILLWMTEFSAWSELLLMSRQRLVGLRKHLQDGSLSEQQKEELLKRFQKNLDFVKCNHFECNHRYQKMRLPSVVHCIRERYILPAVVKDKRGRIYNELTMIKMFAREQMFEDLNLERVCYATKCGRMPSREVVREVLRRKGWTMFEDRCELPSVWEIS